MAYVPAEPFVDGSPLTSYPRFVARKQLSRLAELGFSLKSSFHLEFFLKSKKAGTEYIKRETLIGHFFDVLERTGKDFEVETFHVGTMANRMDGTFKEVLGIKSADYAQHFKTFMREAADSFLHEASVLEKANLSLYFRHSLWDIKGKKCLMGDPDSPLGLSVAAQHWMAGILEHMPAIVRFTHPTQSSWDQVEHEQLNCRWGTDSAGSSVRLHRGEEGKTFVETRQGTGRCNPYLLMAAVVAAGIDGMEKKLPLSEAGTENKKRPTTIAEATEAFEADEVLLAAFDGGKEFLPLLKTSLTFL
ncbi:lengsin-like [Acanthaster planci]|uniref:Lengsin n=1 Tax=Acanthaster planci TaxID=133434 RepID=A0A8B7Z263_ACAPL|nr:lengsin-like [Acanthaster planci]